MVQCCSWCKMGFLGRGSTDQHGRVFCTPDHRAQYLIMNPSRCDNCNGVIHTSRLDTKAERFCSTSCAVEYNPWLRNRLPHAKDVAYLAQVRTRLAAGGSRIRTSGPSIDRARRC